MTITPWSPPGRPPTTSAATDRLPARPTRAPSTASPANASIARSSRARSAAFRTALATGTTPFAATGAANRLKLGDLPADPKKSLREEPAAPMEQPLEDDVAERVGQGQGERHRTVGVLLDHLVQDGHP